MKKITEQWSEPDSLTAPWEVFALSMKALQFLSFILPVGEFVRPRNGVLDDSMEDDFLTL